MIDCTKERNNLIDIESNCSRVIAKSIFCDEIFFKSGVEIEFYLIDLGYAKENNLENIKEPLLSQDYEEISIEDKKIKVFYEKLKEKLVTIEVEMSQIHEEDGKNQFEINIIEDFVVTTVADKVAKFQKIAKETALECDLFLISQGKPFVNDAGSSLQVNISMYNQDLQNLFYHNNSFSNILSFAINGIMQNMDGLVYLSCRDCKNSYFRFKKPKYGSLHINYPTNFSWGINNRTCAIRIPFSKSMNTNDARIEIRTPSYNCNIYDLFSGILYSITAGVILKQKACEPIYEAAYKNENLQIIPKSYDLAFKMYSKSRLYEVINGNFEKYIDILMLEE